MATRSARWLFAAFGVAVVGVAAFLMLRPPAAPPQQAPAVFNPADFVRGRPKLDAPYVATDYNVVDAMLAMAEVRPDDYVVDLGSGDGRILIAAARSHGARGLGIEIDRRRIRESNANAQAASVAHRVTFRREDLFQTPLAEADVLTLYLLPEINIRLRPRILSQMRPGTRVISHQYDMGDWHYDQRQVIGRSTIFMWIVPGRAAGRYRLTSEGRSADLVLDQQYQRVGGSVTANGVTSRVEQGRISGDRIRFIANLGDGRRIFEGRISQNGLESLSGRPWRAVRAG
jgi:hypothetical protein